ncbi:MAG: hypothetical protein OJF49_000303 [Ktedonobacterales bacterium]|jgi:hypothetical protein|nr:MAG: hypothetical protein OJF49_000303 [Ktedonobacterales bacterium]
MSTKIWQAREIPRFFATINKTLLDAPIALTLAGLGCVALALSSDLANTFNAPRSGGAPITLALLVALALTFVCYLAATRLVPIPRLQPHRRRFNLLLYPILIWALFTGIQTVTILGTGLVRSLTVSHVRYGSDDLYYNHYNAVLVLHGENPYTGQRLVDEAAYFGEFAFTPIARGRFADPHHYPTQAEMDQVLRAYLAHPESLPSEVDPRTTHSYPAGAFLVVLPFVAAGIPSIAFPQILLFLLLFAAILRITPAPWRLPVALLALSAADGARQAAGSDFEIWPLAFVALAWIVRERRWSSALLLGVACAIKQTAWLAAPFYLIWVWREKGAAEAARRAALAAVTLLVINAPWIIASPHEWLSSIFLPVSLPLLPDGSGIIGLSLTGLLPLAPSIVFAALEVAALVIALFWYSRAQPRYPYAGLILPLIPLLFAWRSPERYFVLSPLIAVLALALILAQSACKKPAGANITPTGPN